MPGELGLLFTQQQIEQLAKLLPTMMNEKGSKTGDEIDHHFSGMISCFHTADLTEEWIVDSGASDHITSSLSKLSDVIRVPNSPKMKLPT